MNEPSSFSIANRITRLENAVGKLSSVQKMLLGTDGSVTHLLEIVTGSPVEIETLAQRIVPADDALAAELDVCLGEAINHRIVKLKNAKTGETLIYATSQTPLNRLETSFKEDMIRADIPIGVILKKHQIESRREIIDADFSVADKELCHVFNALPRELMLSRNYKIIRQGKPLISIKETFPYNCFSESRKIVIETPSRLHLTLTDLSGCGDRVDGGVGITLEDPSILLEAERSNDLVVSGENQERAKAAAEAVRAYYGLGGAQIRIRSGYKMHVGLGGGTQLGIAIGMALCGLYNQSTTAREIARIIRRGGTSGIGIAAYEMGGFLVDGGHTFGIGKDKQDFRPTSACRGVRPPLVTMRHMVPKDWRIFLAIPNVARGAYGKRELDIFQKYCPVPLKDVHEICYHILARMVPSLVEEDLDGFGASVNRIQELGFKKVELMLQDPIVHKLVAAMREAGAACSGLSSFGPTVYALADTQGRDIEAAANEIMKEVGGELLITRPRNEGARVRIC